MTSRQTKKICTNYFIYNIGYVTPISVKPLHLIINNANGRIEESNGNKYLTLIPTDKSKGMFKKYEKIWSKVKII